MLACKLCWPMYCSWLPHLWRGEEGDVLTPLPYVVVDL
jgi:hypothetical protein